MPAELYSTSLVSRLAIPGTPRVPEGYYRSKLFSHSSTTNPLVAAAGPLLSLLERLCISPSLPPIKNIRDNIDHELNAVHSRLLSLQLAEEFTAIACYLLSATIDELLGKNYLRLYAEPAEFQAFTPSSIDDIGPERRFFVIIDYIKERTSQYLDLLELGYYCLTAGFEGEYHLRADGRQALDNLIEELYQLIQQNRANKSHRLFKEQKNPLPNPTNHQPVIISLLFGITALIAVYFTGHVVLEHKAKTMLLVNPVFSNQDH